MVLRLRPGGERLGTGGLRADRLGLKPDYRKDEVRGRSYFPAFAFLHAAHRFLAALEMAARPAALIFLWLAPLGRPGPRFPFPRPPAPLSLWS